MTAVLEIVTRDLDALKEYFREQPEVARRAAEFAVNDTALYARREGAKQIRKEVNFPAHYVSGENGRLMIASRAHGNDLEAVVRGRDRPTSLARFANKPSGFGAQRTAPRVRVSANGGRASMKGAFFVRLKRGSADVSADSANIGIAIRLKNGERVRGKHTMVPMGKGLYLLYGPSVGQVFRTVAADIEPRVSDRLVDNFIRHYERFR